MDIDYSKLGSLKSLDASRHLNKIKNHEGPGFMTRAASAAVGWGAGIATEAFLGLVVAPATLAMPVLGEFLAPAIELAAPFAAIKVGEWVDRQAMKLFSSDETASATTPSRAAPVRGFNPQVQPA